MLAWIDPTFHATEVVLTALVVLVLTASVVRASPGRMRERIRTRGLAAAFRRSAATNTLAALIALEAVLVGPDLDLADLGLRPVTVGDVLIALGLPAAAAATAALLTIRAGAIDPAEDPLAFLRPATPAERRWAAVGALAAGAGEEIVFRGLFIAAGTATGLPPWAAAALSAVLFGLGHRYQGVRGMIVTTGAAVVFTTLYALTGNLIVPIALHATVDLVSLLLVPALLARQAKRPAATDGVAADAAGADSAAVEAAS
ncbi:CPBP family intramembrane metalloprotease [Dactylosporangium aurantiacum]|uniref:CPBP family intramembrane metalloprotease n=1 Tax=Dactylosporangium aurantiacum TaxID=35754 RepID=A0A9Q9IN04_9ACTN|nr:CPBP family intramembrane glutamic endopeptidase [Dactylosporangium aurantiacum]MDG6109765.1 CPBP family intramembrane metalloprotease [Dactylosporangium aurantiacum]UWZ56299.1 CPBP family intramembrane metalloprotease [Dactylosporangium aurantiacum]